MGYTATRLIEIAKAEDKYKEKASNSQLYDKDANAGNGNYTKYAADLSKAGYYNLNGYAWCDMFTDWCFYKLCDGNKEKALTMTCQNGNNGASCTASMNNYNKAGRLFTAPNKGDQIFFDFKGNGGSSHTGIVYDFDSKYVYTYEGNTNSMSDEDEGNGVYAKKYALNYSKIVGYGRPLYDDETTDTAYSVTFFDSFVANTTAIQSATEHNFFEVKLKSVSATDASVIVALRKAKDCTWSYTLTDLSNDSLLADEQAILDTDLDDIKLTGLTPYTPYALRITASSGSSQQLFFSTIQDYSKSVENLDCTFNLSTGNCKIKFNSPSSWGNYGAFRTTGYRTCLVINGKVVSHSDDLIKSSADAIDVTKQLSVFDGFDTVHDGDILQIGIQTWVKTADQKIILSREGVICSKPFYVKGSLTTIDKIQMKIDDSFKRIALWLNV